MNHCSNRRCHHTGYHRLLGARHASGTARRPASPARSAPPGKNTACAASGPPTAPPGGPTSQQPGCYPCYLAPLHAAATPDSQAAGQSLGAAQAPCKAAPGGSKEHCAAATRWHLSANNPAVHPARHRSQHTGRARAMRPSGDSDAGACSVPARLRSYRARLARAALSLLRKLPSACVRRAMTARTPDARASSLAVAVAAGCANTQRARSHARPAAPRTQGSFAPPSPAGYITAMHPADKTAQPLRAHTPPPLLPLAHPPPVRPSPAAPPAPVIIQTSRGTRARLYTARAPPTTPPPARCDRRSARAVRARLTCWARPTRRRRSCRSAPGPSHRRYIHHCPSRPAPRAASAPPARCAGCPPQTARGRAHCQHQRPPASWLTTWDTRLHTTRLHIKAAHIPVHTSRPCSPKVSSPRGPAPCARSSVCSLLCPDLQTCFAQTPRQRGGERARLHARAGLRQRVVHLRHARRQVLQVPGVALDDRDGDALRRVGHQDLRQQVAALARHLDVRGELVLDLQYPLRARPRASPRARALQAHGTSAGARNEPQLLGSGRAPESSFATSGCRACPLAAQRGTRRPA